MSDFFIYDFVRNEFYKVPMKPCKSQKALRRKDYLLASSIAIATQAVNQPWGYSSFQDGENTGSLKGEGYFIFFENLLTKRKKR